MQDTESHPGQVIFSSETNTPDFANTAKKTINLSFFPKDDNRTAVVSKFKMIVIKCEFALGTRWTWILSKSGVKQNPNWTAVPADTESESFAATFDLPTDGALVSLTDVSLISRCEIKSVLLVAAEMQ